MRADTVPTMLFFGVTTGKSSSLRMFPAWAEILGINGRLVGLDLPMNAPAERYREAVAQIKRDPHMAGALITTHKINVLNAARDLFDGLDQDAELCHEVSCIYKRGGRLRGEAVDPINAAKSMTHFIAPGFWRDSGAEILCLGAGGSAVAIVTHFLTRADAADVPRKITLVNRSAGKLDFLRALVARFPDNRITFEYVQNTDPQRNDALMATLPAQSLVINATGMGKDTPGSPISDAGRFPERAMAWELNYRGELDFLHQAKRQEAARALTVIDGWDYFLYGWSSVVGMVFDVEITHEKFAQLAQAALRVRAA